MTKGLKFDLILTSNMKSHSHNWNVKGYCCPLVGSLVIRVTTSGLVLQTSMKVVADLHTSECIKTAQSEICILVLFYKANFAVLTKKKKKSHNCNAHGKVITVLLVNLKAYPAGIYWSSTVGFLLTNCPIFCGSFALVNLKLCRHVAETATTVFSRNANRYTCKANLWLIIQPSYKVWVPERWKKCNAQHVCSS